MARPREFQEEDALRAAMHLFWRQGYGATSIDDLVRVTGASRGSLYATYGGKQGLFLASIQYYAREFGDLAALSPVDESPLDAIRSYFHRIGDLVSEGHTCMVVGAVTDPSVADSPEVAGITRAQLDRVRGALLAALESASVSNPDAHADHLAVALQGLLLQARAKPPRATIDNYIRLTLSTLDDS